jgi:hypothetical protein
MKMNWIRSLNYFTFNLEIFFVIEIIFNLYSFTYQSIIIHIYYQKKLYFPIIGLAKPREEKKTKNERKKKEKEKNNNIFFMISRWKLMISIQKYNIAKGFWKKKHMKKKIVLKWIFLVYCF